MVAALEHGRGERQLGWPERFFVKLNAVLPGVVDKTLIKQGRLAAACIKRAKAAR